MKILAVVSIFVVTLVIVGWLQPELRKEVLAEVPMVGSAKTTTVYKWQDSQGKWHVSDSPPEKGLGIQTLEYTAKVNVLPLPPALAE